jgi:hypothetical protein
MYTDAYQAEKGLFASSYIPTSDAPVTRKADNITIYGDLFNELFPKYTEGTIFLSAFPAKKNNNFGRYFELKGNATGGGQNNIAVNYNAVTNDSIYCEINSDGISQYPAMNYNIPQGTSFQLAFAWRYNDAKVYCNGNASADDNTINLL